MWSPKINTNICLNYMYFEGNSTYHAHTHTQNDILMQYWELNQFYEFCMNKY